MADEQVELRLSLADGGDADALADSASQLLQELLELDVEDVEPATSGDAPEGAKGVELLAIGAMVVKLVRSTALLKQVVSVVRDWLDRNDAESVRLEIDGDVIEIKGASAEERKALVDTWVKRHTEA